MRNTTPVGHRVGAKDRSMWPGRFCLMTFPTWNYFFFPFFFNFIFWSISRPPRLIFCAFRCTCRAQRNKQKLTKHLPADVVVPTAHTPAHQIYLHYETSRLNPMCFPSSFSVTSTFSLLLLHLDRRCTANELWHRHTNTFFLHLLSPLPSSTLTSKINNSR